MSEKTLKFNNIRLNRIEFHKWKHSDDGFKYFIGYQEAEIVKSLCIILPQMSGHVKYQENGGKNMSFMIKDDSVLNKYNEIWEKLRKS